MYKEIKYLTTEKDGSLPRYGGRQEQTGLGGSRRREMLDDKRENTGLAERGPTSRTWENRITGKGRWKTEVQARTGRG